jgi:hypothetical protein
MDIDGRGACTSFPKIYLAPPEYLRTVIIIGMSMLKRLVPLFLAAAAIACSKSATVNPPADAPLDAYLHLEEAVQDRYQCPNPENCQVDIVTGKAMLKDLEILIARGQALKKAAVPADSHLSWQRKNAFERLETWIALKDELKEDLEPKKPKPASNPKAEAPAKPAPPEPTVPAHFAQDRIKLEEELKDLGCRPMGKGVSCDVTTGSTVEALKSGLLLRAKYREYANLRAEEDKAYKAIGKAVPPDNVYPSVQGQADGIEKTLATVWERLVRHQYDQLTWSPEMYPFPAAASDQEVIAQAGEAAAAYDRVSTIWKKLRSDYWKCVLGKIYVTASDTALYAPEALNYGAGPKGPNLRVAVTITEPEFTALLNTVPRDDSPAGRARETKIHAISELHGRFPLVSAEGARVQSRIELPYTSFEGNWDGMTLDARLELMKSFADLPAFIDKTAQAKNYTGGGRISVLLYGSERDSQGALTLVMDKHFTSIEDVKARIEKWFTDHSR